MRVSREFKTAFDLVARYFRLEELGELEQAKEVVRRNPDDAAISFAEMACWVRLQAVTPASKTNLPVITQAEIDARPRAYGPCCAARLHSLLASKRGGESGPGSPHQGGTRCCSTGLELSDRTTLPGAPHGEVRSPRVRTKGI